MLFVLFLLPVFAFIYFYYITKGLLYIVRRYPNLYPIFIIILATIVYIGGAIIFGLSPYLIIP